MNKCPACAKEVTFVQIFATCSEPIGECMLCMEECKGTAYVASQCKHVPICINCIGDSPVDDDLQSENSLVKTVDDLTASLRHVNGLLHDVVDKNDELEEECDWRRAENNFLSSKVDRLRSENEEQNRIIGMKDVHIEMLHDEIQRLHSEYSLSPRTKKAKKKWEKCVDEPPVLPSKEFLALRKAIDENIAAGEFVEVDRN